MAENVCPNCKSRLPEGETAVGLCPKCLMGAGLGETVDVTRKSAAFETKTEHLGNYQILGVLGEGGMGLVYLAAQEQPIRRRVALKVIKRGMDSNEVLARFDAERQALAMMDHPGIAQIYDASTAEDGRPYFAMEYVQGLPINEYCDKNLLAYRERLILFAEVCDAVHHAHQKGIIHRDLKPSNVLITIRDGRPVVKIIDFGIARALNRELTEAMVFTQQGVFIGTPEYMSPEQADFGGLKIDTRSDIYSLGVILYELLIGALPFDQATLRRAGLVEIRRIIREEEPSRPSTRLRSMGAQAEEIAKHRRANVATLAKELREDLEWITMKALEKDPSRRYASASEFAADIARHLRDEPVVAGPPTAGYRLRKLARRHRGRVVALALVLLAIMLGLITTTGMFVRAEGQRRRAEWEGYKARLVAARAEIQGFRSDQAKEILFQCPKELRGWEWKRLYAMSDNSVRSMRAYGGPNFAAKLAFSDDASRVWVSLADTVSSFDLNTGASLGRYGPFPPIVTMSPDGRFLVCRRRGAPTQVLDVVDLPSGHMRAALDGHQANVTSASFTSDGQMLATGSVDGEIRIWSSGAGAHVRTIKGSAVKQRRDDWPQDDTLAISPDGRRVAFSTGNDIGLWDASYWSKDYGAAGPHGLHPICSLQRR